jgi:hypothetical protein
MDSICTRDTFAYSNMSKETLDTNLRKSSAQVLSSYERAKFYPDEKISPEALEKLTVSPGKSDIKVSAMAEILTHIKNPLNGAFILSPQTFAALPVKKRTELSGPTLEALITFQKVYMGITRPDGSLTPYECKRILTIDIGIMLTQITDTETGKPFLDPKVFSDMPRRMQIKLTEGTPNPVYEAFKLFLIKGQLLKAGTEVTPQDIFSQYPVLRQIWKMMH